MGIFDLERLIKSTAADASSIQKVSTLMSMVETFF